MHGEVQQQVRDTLGSGGFGYLAVDSWTDSAHLATLGYAAGTALSEAFLWDLRRATQAQTAEYLAADIIATKSAVETTGLIVVGCIADNAANVQKVSISPLLGH